MVEIEIANRSGVEVNEAAVMELVGCVLSGEGVDSGEVGVTFVGSDEMIELKSAHLGIAESTDVLSFPIDGRGDLPNGLPRQLGDAVVCPQVTGDAWRGPLMHGLLHLLGYGHGAEMEAREEVYA
jgi:ssRNA-specific RNase YbeY (16S rRNA maturation enzyme)